MRPWSGERIALLDHPAGILLTYPALTLLHRMRCIRMAKKLTAKKRTNAASDHSVMLEARRQAYLEALGEYERGLRAIQQRDLAGAARHFQEVLDRFPEERELHERCRLYLQVVERESRPPTVPKTVTEQLLAATLALNAGTQDEALQHLEAALKREPDSDEVQYMLAVARAANGDTGTAMTHLQRAIELNPDNRFLARQESSFELLQEDETFRQVVKSRTAAPSKGGKARSSR